MAKCLWKVGIRSSRYVLDRLGYSYDTMVFTIRSKNLYFSRSQKLP